MLYDHMASYKGFVMGECLRATRKTKDAPEPIESTENGYVALRVTRALADSSRCENTKDSYMALRTTRALATHRAPENEMNNRKDFGISEVYEF